MVLICARVNRLPMVGDSHPPSNWESLLHGKKKPYYWVDDHPLFYGNTGSLDSGIYIYVYIYIYMYVCI